MTKLITKIIFYDFYCNIIFKSGDADWINLEDYKKISSYIQQNFKDKFDKLFPESNKNNQFVDLPDAELEYETLVFARIKMKKGPKKAKRQKLITELHKEMKTGLSQLGYEFVKDPLDEKPNLALRFVARFSTPTKKKVKP